MFNYLGLEIIAEFNSRTANYLAMGLNLNDKMTTPLNFTIRDE